MTTRPLNNAGKKLEALVTAMTEAAKARHSEVSSASQDAANNLPFQVSQDTSRSV